MSTPILSRLQKVVRDPRFQMLMVAGILGTVALGALAWRSGVTTVELRAWVDQLLAFLREHPAWLFVAIIILPSLPFPASPLLILAGVVYSPIFGVPLTCLLTLLAMVCSMSWSYFLAAYPARGFVERLLTHLEVKIPTLTTGGHVRLIAILRITPGFPFFVQNLVLGFLRVPFRLYLSLSAALCSIFVIGFVVSGGAIFKGNFMLALLGVVLIILAVTLTGFLRKKLVS